MVAEAVYLDLSSSDEDEEDHLQIPNGWADSTALSYLSKVCIFQAEEEEDVVIIDKPKSNDKLKRDKPRVVRTVMDDDECCMLDADPSATETTDCTPPLDSDELVMTGEKGPVACRDFPHARYLCVHFPFKSTPHASFCAQCHCYVCDSLAPCPVWGDGNSASDHCHASEEAPWKSLRKLGKCRPVSTSRAAPTPAATGGTQSGSTVSSMSRVTTPMGVNIFVTPSTLQTHPPSLSPVTQSPVVVPNPVGSGTSPSVRGNTNAASSPLVIRLNAKGRGRPSPHLGVRSPKPPHRSSPVSIFSRSNRSLPIPRARSFPSERIPDPVPPIPAQLPQPPQHSQFYLTPGAERLGSGAAPFPSQQLPAFSSVPGTAGGAPFMTPPVSFPQTLGSSNEDPFYAFQAPPLPSSPPPYIPPPPPSAFTSGGYAVPSPVAVYEHVPMQQQQLPALDTSVAGFVSHVPDSRYVSPSDQQIHMAPHYVDQAYALPRSNYGTDYVAPGFKNPEGDSSCDATSSFDTSHGGNNDILEGPNEGWAADAASLFDSFTPGLGTTTSLEKVLEQMAGDDYLWEQFPSW